jgi:signal transduction histidine kinase
MAAGVAHEIANPLASIDSVLQLMQRNERRLTQANVDILRQQVQRIKQTLGQLTNFAHPTEYTWQTVDVNELLEQGLQMVRFDHRLRRIDLRHERFHDSCPVRVQPHAVQQALTNILFNAIDALADTPSPKLIVRAGQRSGCSYIEVIDNGPGIPTDHLSRVFDPFFTTKAVGKGTGLGLAITQTLMRNQGGQVEVQTDCHGTAFRLVFPHSATTAEADSADARNPSYPSER